MISIHRPNAYKRGQPNKRQKIYWQTLSELLVSDECTLNWKSHEAFGLTSI